MTVEKVPQGRNTGSTRVYRSAHQSLRDEIWVSRIHQTGKTILGQVRVYRSFIRQLLHPYLVPTGLLVSRMVRVLPIWRPYGTFPAAITTRIGKCINKLCMKAIVIHRFGGPEVLQAVQVAEPVVNPSEVLVRVKATSVNPLDYQARRGDYPQEVPLPAIIGYDVAGDVVATGTAVKDFKVGDAVYYSPRIFGGQGSYAEFHAVEESIIALKPANLSYAEAASLPLAAGTAWEMLVTRAQLGIGESILIHGGAGGVGSIAIQLAKAMGATVLTTAKGIHTPRLRDLGADHVIDYRHEDYLSKVDELTQGRGVDVIIDSIGGMTLSESPRVLAQLGRVVTLVDIATPQNLIHAWGKNATYHFVFTRQNRGKLDGITRLVEHGLIKPVIDSSFSLEEIAKAHQRLEGNDRVKDLLGKIVIEL